MSPFARALGVVLTVLGCACSSSRDTGQPTLRSTPPTEVSPVRDVSVDVLRAVCAGTCGGRAGHVTVLRDASGSAQRFRMIGYGCDDGPTTYYDARGRELGGIAMQPVVAGSPEAAAFQAQRDELNAGLTDAESVSCRTVPGVR